VKKTLQIDSADRDTTKYPTNGDYVVYLPRVYKNVTSLRLKGGDFQPLVTGPIPPTVTGLTMWLDAQDPYNSGIQPAINTPITTWYDKSGNGNNGTAAGNNKNAIVYRLDSNNESSIQLIQAAYFTTPYTAAPTAETIFVVFTVNGVSDSQGLITGDTSYRGFVLNANGTNLQTTKGGTGYFTCSNNITLNTIQLAESVYNGNATIVNGNAAKSLTQYVNSTNPSTDTTTQYVYSGSGTSVISSSTTSGGFIGTMNEILIYNTALSSTDRQKIESYLSKKWNIPMPNGHPVYTYTTALSHSIINGENKPSINTSIDQVLPKNTYYFLLEIEGLNKSDETRLTGDKSAFVDKYFAKIPACVSPSGNNITYNDKNLQENIATYTPAIGELDRLHIKTRTHAQQDGSGFIYWPNDYNLTFEIEYMDNQPDAKIEQN
jgi:hypothetical protein